MRGVHGLRALCVATGLLCLALAAVSAAAGADPVPGSGFLSFSLAATAPGSQFTYDYPGATPRPQAEGEVPQSIAQLQSGPQGYALSSIAWPGPLVANAGSTSQLLNLGVPPSVASNMNDPVRAEARTGSGPPTVTNNSYPGVAMTASSTVEDVEADATMAGANGPAPQSQSGNTETSSSAKLTGPGTATASAFSVVHDISLAGGVVTIKEVTSTASALTDGVQATGSGSTVVSGVEVGGQPAYIDDHGVHLGQSGPSAPVNTIATAIANQALQGAGMKVAVSVPTTQGKGSQLTYDAGNVVFYWAPPGDTHGDTFTATFGGASVSVDASRGSGLTTGLLPGIPLPASSGSAGGSVAPVASSGNSGLGSGAVSPVSGGSTASGSGVASAPAAAGVSVAPPVVLSPARAAYTLPGGLSPMLPILVLIGSGLIAAGLRRLPDRLLEGPSAACDSGGQ